MGSFNTPVIKFGHDVYDRKESSVWNKYNKLDERRKESDEWGGGSDLRKMSMDYGAVVTQDEVVYDDWVEGNTGGEKCYPLTLGGTKLPKGHT